MKLANDHPIQCRCRKLTGVLSAGAKITRATCYCRDCQAFADALGGPEGILDTNGGTEIVASLQQSVSFTGGTEQLACLSLSEHGLLRWYANCCNTPIANTARSPKLSYVGFVHSCLGREARSLDADFGPPGITFNAKNAKGVVPSSGFRTVTITVGIFGRVIRARMNGSWRQSPFFDRELRPVAKPRVLGPS
jgi:hypothetical protein